MDVENLQLAIVNYWLGEIQKLVNKTIKVADGILELNESDLKAIVFNITNRLLGYGSNDYISADRDNEIDDLIIANLIMRSVFIPDYMSGGKTFNSNCVNSQSGERHE